MNLAWCRDRWRPLAAALLVLVVVVGLAVVGAVRGPASAQPRSSLATVTAEQLWPQAGVTGAVILYTGAGPEGSTLALVGARVAHNGLCVGLAVNPPSADHDDVVASRSCLTWDPVGPGDGSSTGELWRWTSAITGDVFEGWLGTEYTAARVQQLLHGTVLSSTPVVRNVYTTEGILQARAEDPCLVLAFTSATGARLDAYQANLGYTDAHC